MFVQWQTYFVVCLLILSRNCNLDYETVTVVKKSTQKVLLWTYFWARSGRIYLIKEAAYNHLLPALADLSALVAGVQVVQPNHHHDVTERNLWKTLPA